jgi:hypothetical protein
MDIHPPQGPVSNMKEFGVHIAIVTIGILIALTLEGVIETVQNAHLVHETRQNFQSELTADQSQAAKELASDRAIHAGLDQLVADLPALFKTHPEQIRRRLGQLRSSGYFFPAQAWQSALSTGSLAHMPPDEVQRYSSTYYMLHTYSDIEMDGYKADTSAQAFFISHSPLKPADYSEGAERIVLYDEAAAGLQQVCEQMQSEINNVLPPQAKTK